MLVPQDTRARKGNSLLNPEISTFITAKQTQEDAQLASNGVVLSSHQMMISPAFEKQGITLGRLAMASYTRKMRCHKELHRRPEE